MKNAWQNFNDWIDPKFGVHVFWIVPAVLVLSVYDQLTNRFTNWHHRVKIKKILKDNLDINELSKLSGIDNERKN